jgi:hypothetical protein
MFSVTPVRGLSVLVGAMAIAAVLYGCGGGNDAAVSPTVATVEPTVAPVDLTFSVAVIGDSPYGIAYGDTAQYLANPAFIAKVNADTSLSAALHVGDIHSGKEFCTETYNLGVFNQWKAGYTKLPLIYTPGDNEWTDCHKAKEGGGTYNTSTFVIDYVTKDGGSYANGDPLANLTLIRSIFFPAPGKSLGSGMSLHSQALEFDPAHPADAQFVENVWFEKNGVLFFNINVPGGSNNDDDNWYGTPTKSNAQAQEVAARTAANLRWIDAAFAKAIANKNVGVVIQVQADMWDQDGSPAGKAHLTNYKQFIDKIASNTTAFAKPVLLVNGDSHTYRSDNPLVPNATCVAEKPVTAVVGAPLVPATSAVACTDASVASVMATYHADSPGTTDPYANQPNGYNVSNFHRVVVHTNPANPQEYLKLSIDPSVNAANGSTAFGPFSWKRIAP